jgi:putative membrane protein
MITKKNFSPLKVLGYIWQEVLFTLVWSSLIWGLYRGGYEALAINFTPIGILGSALAIFVAFRNNSAYGRWWEARQIWGALVNHSREFARMVNNFVDVQIRAYPEQRAAMTAFKIELVYRHIAFVHALRLHLRRQTSWEELQPFLSAEDYKRIVDVQNKPNFINMLNGDCLRRGQDQKMLEWFHTFQIEGNLTQFAHHLGGSERIKNTPLPRQYDFFTRLFVWTFAILLPLGLLSLFGDGHSWVIVPLATVIAAVFTIMEKTGAANENPFENSITDVPLTALCRTIERDLREMLGEQGLPRPLEPVGGYLF